MTQEIESTNARLRVRILALGLVLSSLTCSPAKAATLHEIHGCVLETWQPVKDKLVEITYLDLRKVQNIQVLSALGKVGDNTPLKLTLSGSPAKPYRIEPGEYKAPEIIQRYIGCLQAPNTAP